MNAESALKRLVPLTMLLALVAAVAGLWPAAGTPYPITSFRGEQVMINARGLYYWDTVSGAAQMQANDLVTLVFGLPLLGVSLWLTLRGSLRGRLLLTGTLGFVLYTYITMCFGTAYNQLFLVYVALLGLSAISLVVSLVSFDARSLAGRFSERLPRRGIAALLVFTAAFLLLAWLGRIVPTLLGSQVPALENVTSMFIQALDLGIVVPLCLVAAVLLTRRSPWGYLLASVALMKFLTVGLAVTLMGLNMARVGVPVNAVEVGIFATITIVNTVMAISLLRSIDSSESVELAPKPASQFAASSHPSAR